MTGVISALHLVYLAAGTSIVVAGDAYDVGRPVVLWSDPTRGFNGYSEECVEESSRATSPCCRGRFKRYGQRRGVNPNDLSSLQEAVNQLILHHDGCANSRSCFYSMHDMPRGDHCGLSAHFMIDSDGTIYQTLDVSERAYHAEQSNQNGIGVEICNLADAGRKRKQLPLDYATRPVRNVVINGHNFEAFDFRPEQYRSVIALSRVLLRVLPGIKPVIPMENGEVLLSSLPEPTAFAGIVGHLHVDQEKQKWDPGAFRWDQFMSALNGVYLPIQVRGYSQISASDEAEVMRITRTVFDPVEEKGTGHFPISTGGVWHSGVQLPGKEGAVVIAPLGGQLVAARLAQHGDDSTSFVLIRHTPEIAGQTVTFFSLLAHLQTVPVRADTPLPWLRALFKSRDRSQLDRLRKGGIAMLNQRLTAGETIGMVGRINRGPEQARAVRFEIFSAEKAPENFGPFRYVRAQNDGIISNRGAILSLLGARSNDAVTTSFLGDFYRSDALPQRQALRRLVFQHVHEWSDAWDEKTVATMPELAALTEEQRQMFFRERLEPYRIWTRDLVHHARIPSDGVVFSYNPITFLASLAASRAGFTLNWPAASAVDEDKPARAVSPSTLSPWLDPPKFPESAPTIFGPLVRTEIVPLLREQIPLIDSESTHE